MSHYLKLHVPAARATISADVLDNNGWRPGIALNLSYLYFGTIAIGGDAAPDQNGIYSQSGYYNTATQSCVGQCGAIRYFNTGGTLQALALTAEPFWRAGNWRFGLEGGVAVFRATWTANMTVMSPTSPWGPRGSVQTLSHDARPQLTWVAGASVAYKHVVMRYTYISTPSRNVSDSNIPLGFKGAHMLTIGYRW